MSDDKSMKRLSIREKLIFYFLLLGILAIGIISFYFYFKAKDALINRTYEQLTSLRIVKKKRIETFFSDRIRETRLLSHNNDIVSMLSMLNTPVSDNSIEKIHRIYKRSLSSLFTSNDFHSFILVNPAGNMLEINTDGTSPLVPNASARALIEVTKKLTPENSLQIFDMNAINTDSCKFIHIASLIDSPPGQIIGYIVLRITERQLNRIMLETGADSGMGKTGESYIVGDDYLMRSNSRFKDSSSAHSIIVKNFAVNDALAGHAGILLMKDYRNILVLNSHEKLNTGFPWVIMSEIDYNEAMIPIFELRNEIIFISIFIAFILFISVFILAGKITKPLIRLREAINKLSKGDFNLRVETGTKDEIGDLSEAFNNMTHKIKQQNDELVEEKSKQMISFIDGQEIERQRLSRELHDGLGQSLIAIKLRLESITHVDMSKIRYVLALVKDLFDKTIDDIRRMSNDLMPVVLNDFGLETAIRTLCENIEDVSRIGISFTAGNIPENLDKKAMTYIYRIIQESLNNIVKHSCADKAEVKLFNDGHNINLMIKDNGVGFNVKTAHSGNGSGLYNIHERVNILHGNIKMVSEPEQGTTIIIQIPFSNIIEN